MGKYQETVYTTIVYVTDNETGERVPERSIRTVYRNELVDPELVVDGKSNLERMQSGNSPFVLSGYDEDGNPQYSKVELHHILSQETYMDHGGRGGTLIEISSDDHDQYSKQLHAIRGDSQSFRYETVEITDEHGQVIARETQPTIGADKYNQVKSQYWMDRGNEYAREHGLPEVGTRNSRSLSSDPNQNTMEPPSSCAPYAEGQYAGRWGENGVTQDGFAILTSSQEKAVSSETAKTTGIDYSAVQSQATISTVDYSVPESTDVTHSMPDYSVTNESVEAQATVDYSVSAEEGQEASTSNEISYDNGNSEDNGIDII